ncbi:hypothetical protein JW916_02205 [Candidatus Sumerlaeota bacterium]|nr:hypothetical protein [Candidatus Sumerlaeota bacterium]
MRMTPTRFVAFRSALIAFGWVPGFSGALKAILVRLFVRTKTGPRYVAQSRFLDLSVLEEQATAFHLDAASNDDGRDGGAGPSLRSLAIGIVVLLVVFAACHGKYVKSGFFMYDENLYMQQNTLATAYLSLALRGSLSPLLADDLRRNAAATFGSSVERLDGMRRSEAARAYFRTLAAVHTKPLFHVPLPPIAVLLGLPMRETIQVSANLICGLLTAAIFGVLFARRFGAAAGAVAAALPTFSLMHSCYLPSGFPVTVQACLLVGGLASYLWASESTGRSGGAGWAAAGGALLALSQLAYPTTMFLLIVLAILEGLAALVVLRRSLSTLAILVGLGVFAVLPNAPSLFWYKADVSQGYALVTNLSEAARWNLVVTLSVLSIALSIGLLFLSRRHGRQALRLGWLCFAIGAVFTAANLLYAFFGPGYFSMLLVHANPAANQKREIAEALRMLAHAEGPILFGIGALCVVSGWLLFLARAFRGKAGRWDILAVLWFPLTYLLILQYGHHFERRNYVALYTLYFVALLYAPSELLRTRPGRVRSAAKWIAAAVCVGLLAGNWGVRHRALYWNRYRAAGESSRACSASGVSPILAIPLRYFNPAPLPQGRVEPLYSELAPDRRFGILACESAYSSETLSLSLPWGAVLRRHMTPLFQTTAFMCPMADGVSQRRSLRRDTLRTSSFDYVIRLYGLSPNAVARFVPATEAFDPEGWRPASEAPSTGVSSSDFVENNRTMLLTRGAKVRLSSRNLNELFGSSSGGLFLEVYSNGPEENVLEAEIGRRRFEIAYRSAKAVRDWVPLAPWASEESTTVTLATRRVEQRCVCITGLGLYPGPSPPSLEGGDIEWRTTPLSE